MKLKHIKWTYLLDAKLYYTIYQISMENKHKQNTYHVNNQKKNKKQQQANKF